MTPEQVKEARLTLGLSQSQMCKALRLTSVMTYAKWEQGTAKPTAAAAAAIEMLLYMRAVGVLDGWISKKYNQLEEEVMIGSTLAVQEAEAQCRENDAQFIAQRAAEFVAAKDMGRKEAIRVATAELSQLREADVTGVMGLENKLPTPSRNVQPAQVAAIASELLGAAQNAADNL